MLVEKIKILLAQEDEYEFGLIEDEIEKEVYLLKLNTHSHQTGSASRKVFDSGMK